MQFGDNIIRGLASDLRTIKERFELLQWIDKQNADQGDTDKDYTDPDDEDAIGKFVFGLLKKAKLCLRADKAGAFLVQNDGMAPFERQDISLTEKQEKQIVAMAPPEASKTEILTDKDRDLAFLTLMASPSPFFNIAFVFQSELLGGETSAFDEQDCKEFAGMINTQCKLFLNTWHSREMAANKDKLLNEFFRAHLDIDDCFLKLTELFARFLPTWSPGRIDSPPLVQILTYSGDQQSIVLRSTISQTKSPAKTLLLEKTICGLLIEREEALQTEQDFLYVNPTDEKYRDRYASYLFDEPPRSELVIPLRGADKGGKLIGLINLEHKEQNIFSDFHISLLREGAKSLESFVNALITEEQAEREKDIGVFYVLQKILTKMATTYQHKVGQNIATSKFSLETLEESLVLDAAQQRQFTRLKEAVLGFADHTKNFNKDLPDFVRFGKISIVPIVEQAMSEFDPGGLTEHGDIQFKLDVDEALTDDEKEVFASVLAREHIYNIMNNSVYAVRERMTAEEIDKGQITVKIYKHQQKDKEDKTDSFPFTVVCVEDNGGGMTEEAVSKTFTSRFSTKGSSGFGMTAALEYMTAIHGNMGVINNEPGVGVAIAFYFPVFTQSIHSALENSLNMISSQEA